MKRWKDKAARQQRARRRRIDREERRQRVRVRTPQAPMSIPEMRREAVEGRDVIERSWRTTFRGIHQLGYKSRSQKYGSSGLGGLTRQQPKPESTSRSGAQKRRARGRRRLLREPEEAGR